MSQASLKGSTPSISPPPVTASAMLQAGGLPLTRPLPPTRALSQTHQPTPPFAAPLPGKRKKAAIHASSSAACSSSADSAPSDVAAAESATTADYDVESVRVSASKDALAACSSDAVPDANNSVKGQGRSSVLETETLHSSPAPASYRTDAALTDCDSSQQQLPKLSIPAERQAAEATALQTCSNVAKRNAAQASSRPSSTHSKQGASSSFDRRLALLHKGLPTYMPPSFAAATRPSSRSRRASTPGLPATPSHQPPAQLSTDPNCLPGSDWTAEESSSALDAAAGARNGTTNGLTSDAANGITHGTTNGITPLASEAALPHPGVHHATTLAAPTGEAAWVGNEGSMSKPSSPTSVLPNQGGLGDTTYHSSHGLADAYPELYRAAAAAGRAQKANSRALQCFVGDTLRGNPDLWRHQLKSAYTLCNDRLKHDAVGEPCLCPLAFHLLICLTKLTCTAHTRA